jgi:peroxiredoxin
MKTITFRFLSLLLLGTFISEAQTSTGPLKAGDSVPDVSLRTEANRDVSLRGLISKNPAVLIFYRGGWCPFCNHHLQSLAGIEEELDRAGVQLLAISTDKPEKLKATPDRDKLGCQLLSDSDAAAARGFGIAFKVDDATVEKYKEYGIDLEAASGKDHHILPHPAVFVVDTSGTIRFSHVNHDYKVRLEPLKILEAARAAAASD